MDTRVFELILEDTLLECPPTPPHLSHTRTRARALSLALSLSHTLSLTHSLSHTLSHTLSVLFQPALEMYADLRCSGDCARHANYDENCVQFSIPMTHPRIPYQNQRQQPTFKGKGAYHRGCTEGSIVADDIAAEAKAQIAWFVANVGK